MGRLEGRTAIVTGAGAGLGLGIADELALEGANVAVLEVDAAAGEAAATRLAGRGVGARFYATDVASREQVDSSFEAVARDFGRLDVVVNNAGISRVGPHTHEVSDEDWLDSIAVMQTGVFWCMRAAGRLMLPQGSGSVVNISSIRGFSPNVGRMTYCTPKAAVIMMTRVTAGEWAPHGVRVNAVCPGVLRTPMWDRDVERGAIDEGFYLDAVPMHRLGSTAEVGKLVAYLASDDAAYVTGAVLTIDGGLTSIPAG